MDDSFHRFSAPFHEGYYLGATPSFSANSPLLHLRYGHREAITSLLAQR
jgi:hypothetical protein